MVTSFLSLLLILTGFALCVEHRTSSNWAGAITADENITSVTGTFTVPTMSFPTGADLNATYGIAIWVGIQGAGAYPESTDTTGTKRLRIFCIVNSLIDSPRVFI